MPISQIHKIIKSSGNRLTKTRKAILEILLEKNCLLTKDEIVQKLKDKKIKPDRSTIYRELLFLAKNGIVQKNAISEKEYYEIPLAHHHHLICLNCNKVKKIEMNNHLVKEENQIAKKNKFNIVNHSLEFYGYCAKCNRQTI